MHKVSGNKILRKIYSFTIRLYPSEFKKEYEKIMMDTFEEMWEEENDDISLVWLLSDSITGIVKEHTLHYIKIFYLNLRNMENSKSIHVLKYLTGGVSIVILDIIIAILVNYTVSHLISSSLIERTLFGRNDIYLIATLILSVIIIASVMQTKRNRIVTKKGK